jgi:transposase-like protein
MATRRRQVARGPPQTRRANGRTEEDALAFIDTLAAHRAKLRPTNRIERPSGEIKQRVNVVGIFSTTRQPFV